jgi:3-oxoacyl-[acyl-carrier protein] reductase
LPEHKSSCPGKARFRGKVSARCHRRAAVKAKALDGSSAAWPGIPAPVPSGAGVSCIEAIKVATRRPEETDAMTNSPSQTPSEFERKVVVVTGGSAGIGRAVAYAFAKSGAKVVVAGRDLEAASRVAADIEREMGGQAISVQADVSAPDDCNALIDAAVTRFGAVDILVNNAAYFALIPLLDLGAEEAARMLYTNFCGPLFCGQAMARWATANKRTGAIVNVSSISGARPAYGCGLYSATKAALNSLTKSMAFEWTPKGIRVNGVAPGHVNTDGVKRDFASGRLDYEAMMRNIPAHRVADVDDIADAVLFLSSERSRHVVGATLTIDGGESL